MGQITTKIDSEHILLTTTTEQKEVLSKQQVNEALANLEAKKVQLLAMLEVMK